MLNNTYGKWLKQTKEKYKQIGIEVKEKSDGRILFVLKRSGMIEPLLFDYSCGILFITLDGETFQEKINELPFLARLKCKNWRNITREIVEALAISLEAKVILFLNKEYGYYDMYGKFRRSIQWFFAENVKELDGINTYNFTGPYKARGSIYKDLEEEFMQSLIEKVGEIKNAFSKLGKMTTEVYFEEDEFIKKHKLCMRIYHEGLHEEILLDYQDSKFKLIYNTRKESYVYDLHQEEEMKEAVKDILYKMEQKQRIKNISNPPMHHFYNKVKVLLSVKAKQTLYELLLTKMEPQELEEKCAMDESYFRTAKEYRGINIYFFLDYIVAVSGEHVRLYEKNEKEKAKKEMIDLVVLTMEKEAEDEIKELFS